MIKNIIDVQEAIHVLTARLMSLKKLRKRKTTRRNKKAHVEGVPLGRARDFCHGRSRSSDVQRRDRHHGTKSPRLLPQLHWLESTIDEDEPAGADMRITNGE